MSESSQSVESTQACLITKRASDKSPKEPCHSCMAEGQTELFPETGGHQIAATDSFQ